MNFYRKKEPSGEQPKAAALKETGYQRVLIAAAIMAVFVLHFVWQYSFIQKENLLTAEDSLRNARLNVPPAENQPDERVVEVKPDLTAKKANVENTAKRVLPIRYSPPENKSPRKELKRKAAREQRSERLRRAEKLLTGF